MKLPVYYDCHRTGTVSYGINVPDGQTVLAVTKLRRRIEAMARRELGSDFVAVKVFSPAKHPVMYLNVKVGTSQGENRFALRSLIGWIELFDSEEPDTENNRHKGE